MLRTVLARPLSVSSFSVHFSFVFDIKDEGDTGNDTVEGGEVGGRGKRKERGRKERKEGEKKKVREGGKGGGERRLERGR